MAKLLSFLLPLLLVFAGGCVTNPITGRNQTMLVGDAEAAQQSALAYNQLLGEAQQERALDNNPAVLNRVRAVARNLIGEAVRMRPETANWQWDVHVLASDEVNAWCMAGGKIAVYSGLLHQIQPTDDELAQVLGHEISHALLSHQAERMSRAKAQKYGLTLGVIAGAVAGYDLRGAANMANTLANVGLQLPNSREAETEADNVGIELAARAGYNPNAAVSLWQKMMQTEGGGSPEWLSTHPNPASRIQNMQMRAQQLMPVYQAARR
jgi:predicted Zn-dependent protease